MYIHKAAVDKDHIYSLISQEVHMKALNDFGWSAAYNLWVYLCCNQDGYIENFSPTHIGQLAHKDRRTIQRAVKELEDKGYLFQVAENDYIFFENPNDNGCDTSATSLGCSTGATSLNINKEENLDKKRCDIDATGGATSVSQGATLVLQECDTGVYSNIINNIDNINNNIEFSPYDLSTKVENHCEENSSYGDDMNKDVHPLSKDEIRPIYTRDGCKYDLSISCILDGLSNALSNRKNEDVLKEISEKCDLTDKQRSEIEDTIELWRLGF